MKEALSWAKRIWGEKDAERHSRQWEQHRQRHGGLNVRRECDRQLGAGVLERQSKAGLLLKGSAVG